MNFHYAGKNVFFPHFLFVTLFSQGWLAWLAIFILPPIFSRFRLAGSTKHKTSSLTIRKTWNLRQKLLQPSAKKGFSTCIKIVVSNGWWKKHSTVVLAACQLFAILAARVAGVGSLSARANMAIRIFVKRVFTIFATNASFLRIFCKFAYLTQYKNNICISKNNSALLAQ